MTTQTNETIEALEAEIGELKRRREEALGQIRRAETRFGELEELRTEFSPKAFSGDEAAARELEAIEDEHDVLARSVRVARSALPEFERMLEEAKGKLAEERLEVHRARRQALLTQAGELDAERDELARRLHEILDKQDGLYFDALQELNSYDQDAANRTISHGYYPIRDYLTGAFSRWLA